MILTNFYPFLADKALTPQAILTQNLEYWLDEISVACLKCYFKIKAFVDSIDFVIISFAFLIESFSMDFRMLKAFLKIGFVDFLTLVSSNISLSIFSCLLTIKSIRLWIVSLLFIIVSHSVILLIFFDIFFFKIFFKFFTQIFSPL